MARFVSIIIAILRTRFVSITTVIIETLYKYIFIETTIIIIIKKNNQNKNIAREEGESRERDLPGHEKGRAVSDISRVQCPLLYNLPKGSPEVATLSNTID